MTYVHNLLAHDDAQQAMETGHDAPSSLKLRIAALRRDIHCDERRRINAELEISDEGEPQSSS